MSAGDAISFQWSVNTADFEVKKHFWTKNFPDLKKKKKKKKKKGLEFFQM